MSFMAMPSLHFLLLSILLILDHHATEISTTNSLVLRLTQSPRKITDFPTKKTAPPYSPTKTSQTLDINEPLKEITNGYIMSLPLGTPLQTIQKVFFDTGSDLVWVPCASVTSVFQCIDCHDNYKYDRPSVFDPTSSRSIVRDSCSSPSCVDLHSSENDYDTCAMARCPFRSIVSRTCDYPCPSFAYKYAGGAAFGILSKDILGAHADDNPKNPTISFGCVRATLNEPYGIAGFGRGPLSLPSQLGFSRKGFSHCFLPFEFSSNPNISCPLILGDMATSSKDHLQFTPMLKNTLMYPNFYYVGLEAITVGNLPRIQAPLNLTGFDPSGNGGMIIDSGTSYTQLPEPLYSQLLSSLRSLIDYPRATDVEDRAGFDLCYRIPTRTKNNLPSITLHFSKGTSLTLARGTCFYKMAPPKDSAQANCLLFERMEDAEYGPAGVLGSFQQQNVEVVYDLEKERIGFQPSDCVSYAKSHGLQKT